MSEEQIERLKAEVTPERLYEAFIKACEPDNACCIDGPIHAHRGRVMVRIDIREV